MSADMLQPGFADPVAGAQSCFRAVLDAMARPGRIREVGTDLTPPAPLAPATAAVLLTLLDYDTPVWLDPAFAGARNWVGFHCGAPIVAAIGACRFAVALALPELAALPSGTHEAPEDAATLILQVNAFGRGRTYRLAGPGLRVPALLSVDLLPAGFATAWQENHALFPRGADIVLCAGTALAALPRSVTLQEV
ncbi:MAG TPA: phosphonate C-P lyase system protein PhnH [Acetobacteraceae bacterium]|nr:phosphonate C-P lyase system protein PhnH [Acetobacteraceae bacterium]